MRAIVFVIIGLMFGGCMQETLAPVTQAGWSARDRALMSNLPYAQATPEEYRRHIVQYARQEAPGTIVVDSSSKFLYYVLPKGQAIRYGVTVGEDAQAWSRNRHGRPQGRMAVVDTDRGRARAAWAHPGLCDRRATKSDGCARAICVLGGKDTQYRIHGTNQPEYIGRAICSGCIRMTNEDVIDLYGRVKVGTIVVVLAPTKPYW